MKRAMAVLLILSAHELFACKNTSRVRVHFYGCPTGAWGHVMLGNVDATLPKVGDDIFEGVISASIGPDYKIKVAHPVQLQVCCETPPKPAWTENCVLEYAVYCDTRNPAWGIVASSEEPDVHFSFAPEHLNDLDVYTCSSRAQINAATNTVANLGDADIVEVRVIRGGVMVARFPVNRTNVENGAYPLTREDLKRINDEAGQQSYQSYAGTTRDYQQSQPALPSKVTVVKR